MERPSGICPSRSEVRNSEQGKHVELPPATVTVAAPTPVQAADNIRDAGKHVDRGFQALVIDPPFMIPDLALIQLKRIAGALHRRLSELHRLFVVLAA